MQDSKFDESAAIENLKRREKTKTLDRETLRKKLLDKARKVLIQELKLKNVEVWVIGSLIQIDKFSERSDIDIVIKNYNDDRFDLWTLLEKKIGHRVEIIRYEECGFQDDILKTGLKVL